MLHFTLRELQAYFKNKATWAILIAVTVVAVISGPFGTHEIDVFKRIVYWAVAVFGCAIIGHICYNNVQRIGEAKQWSVWLSYFLGAIISSFIIGLFVYALVVLFFGKVNHAPSLISLWGFALVINVSIAAIILFMSQHYANQNPAASMGAEKLTPKNNLLFDKLSKNLGRDIISISSQDHYLEVVTAKGRELILMRLSDAIAALPDDMGLQIHRSHWVAKSAILELSKEGGKWELVMKNEARFPVSRNYRDDVKGLEL